MKYVCLFTAFLFVLATGLSCNPQSKNQNNNIYFSYRSSDNIIFSVSKDMKEGEAVIAGKKYTGIIKPNKYDGDRGIYDFFAEGNRIFIFEPDENEITIINQRDDIKGVGGKYIELLPINQPENMELLYYEESNYILDSIPLMNDKAFYLEQVGAYNEAVFILNKVIEKRPDRVVAYLNIADAYWGLNNKKEAKKSYQKYLELMKSQGKDLGRVPQRVYDRVK